MKKWTVLLKNSDWGLFIRSLKNNELFGWVSQLYLEYVITYLFV